MEDRATRIPFGALVFWLTLAGMGCGEDGDASPEAGASDSMGETQTIGKEESPVEDASMAGGAGSGADSMDEDSDPVESSTGGRPQDGRTFTIDEATLPFEALEGIESDRWTGVLDGAGYRIEVPTEWNGILVMYAHGYVGTGEALRVSTPPIREHLIEQGYAWAASSYSRNYYDVRAGVEDTNALALAFTEIAADNGRMLDEPVKRYLMGHSMGGHVTGAAIEKEAMETAANQVTYAAALPMCGVMGDLELFNYFAAYHLAAQHLAGTPVAMTPEDFMAVRMETQDALFTEYPTMTTAAGDQLKMIVQNLTGGARPLFDEGFAARTWQDAVWGTFGRDGTINGILELPVVDTRMVEYQLDDDPALSEEEEKFNAEVARAEPAPEPNPLREDGVRWIPVIHGEIDIPVLSLHTLGDLFVPFHMQQIYRRRVDEMGNGEHLVQRAIRGSAHCGFSQAEQVAAFDALAAWEQDGVKPEGDDVLDPEVVSAADYGCRFTDNGAPACP